MLEPGEYFCDVCGKKHDIHKDHCAIGEHCIGTDATCNSEWGMDDHSKKCCICGEEGMA